MHGLVDRPFQVVYNYYDLNFEGNIYLPHPNEYCAKGVKKTLGLPSNFTFTKVDNNLLIWFSINKLISVDKNSFHTIRECHHLFSHDDNFQFIDLLGVREVTLNFHPMMLTRNIQVHYIIYILHYIKYGY